jgi:hypothetical protein
MAVTIHQISPVAHLPLVLGVVRKLQVAALIDTFCPPHPANIVSCGRGVEALLLAILDGHHALYKALTQHSCHQPQSHPVACDQHQCQIGSPISCGCNRHKINARHIHYPVPHRLNSIAQFIGVCSWLQLAYRGTSGP